LAKDGALVVIHDESLDRTTNGHGYVKDFMLNELRRFDAGKGEHIPTLEEILMLTRGRVVSQIELKVEEAAQPAARLVKSMRAEKEVVITSFMHELLGRLHRSNSNLRTGALFFDVHGDICQKALDIYSESIHAYFRNVNSELVREAHNRGLKVQVWNPDDAGEMRKMISLGVDGIGTNRPDILLSLLKSMGMR